MTAGGYRSVQWAPPEVSAGCEFSAKRAVWPLYVTATEDWNCNAPNPYHPRGVYPHRPTFPPDGDRLLGDCSISGVGQIIFIRPLIPMGFRTWAYGEMCVARAQLVGGQYANMWRERWWCVYWSTEEWNQLTSIIRYVPVIPDLGALLHQHNSTRRAGTLGLYFGIPQSPKHQHAPTLLPLACTTSTSPVNCNNLLGLL